MPIFRKTFSSGRMQLDVDNRLLPDGEYREATNVIVINNEIGEEGGITKSYSNKRLTNLNLGVNPITLGGFTYNARNRIYWLVLSDSGSFLIEYDANSNTTSFLLKETRAIGSRVFDLKKDFPCTAINIIAHEDPNKELILLTENNMEPLCINISRAKTYGENGFEKEDIYLIKSPPKNHPNVSLTYTGGLENYMEETFQLFGYRYKYLDGEYSAFSDFTNYQFAPGEFELDLQSMENIGMINRFNAVRITFNTGDKRVTDIQLILKKTNSNVPYLIETFNKEDEQWGDNLPKSFVFANEKIYQALPERELFRTFDNVPRKSLAQTIIGNKVVFGNYLEGYNLLDENFKKINANYTLSIISRDITGVVLDYELSNSFLTVKKTIDIDFTGIEFNIGNSIRFGFEMESGYNSLGVVVKEGSYDWTVDYVLDKTYADLAKLYADPEFISFITETLTANFNSKVEFTPPDNSTLVSSTSFVVSNVGNILSITAPEFLYQIDNTPEDDEDTDFTNRTYYWFFNETSSIFYRNFSVSSSVKTNRSYDIGLLYMDEFRRKTTVITSKKSTIYIPQTFSVNKNTIKVSLDSLPPYWAKSFKFVIKQTPLTYQTIYASVFFEDGLYRWIKLEGDNKDKVKEGDVLIVKKDIRGALQDVIKVNVLEKKVQETDFITGNNDEDGAEIIEPLGTYIKIKPQGFFIDYSPNEFFFDEGSGGTVDNRPFVRNDKFSKLVGTDVVDLKITQGSVITIKLESDGRDRGKKTFEKTYISDSDYDNFKLWFDATVLPNMPLSIIENDTEKYTNVSVLRGNAVGENGIVPDPTGFLHMMTEGITPGNGGSRRGYLTSTVTIRLVDGFVIFETEPKQSEDEIYYETEQSYDIVDGKHLGNLQNQTDLLPAEFELDFFNCYVQGNGAESYRVKDGLNKNYLNIDTKPTSTSIEEYQEIRRGADLTYSESFVESSNINGLNVFNLSTANFKDDLDKQYGSVQKLHSRQNDIVVLQEEKAGKVLFDKDAIFTADGNAALTSVPGVLGQWVPYQGNRGIGKNPESFSVDDDGRIKFASIRNGSISRLSLDGIEDIVYGVKSFFRDLFIAQPNARIISGFDPFLEQTVFSIGNEPERIPLFNCSNEVIKTNQDVPFSYNLLLNNLGGDIVFSYNITSGNATIQVVFNEATTVVSNVTGTGNIVVVRNSLVENIATIIVTPIGAPITYSIFNTCPIGTELEIVMVVLNDNLDNEQTITNRFRRLSSSFISNDDIFNEGPVTRFQSIIGTEGVGSFPTNDDVMIIQSFKDSSNSGKLDLTKCNRLGFLISDADYEEADYLDIINDADTQFITVTETGEEDFSSTVSGNFIFNRTSTSEKLYLIWDYTDRNPVLTNDSATASVGDDVVIDVLVNDEVSVDATVEITVQPLYGTAVVNIDQTITYTHDGSDNFDDELTYQVTDNGCSSTAKVIIGIGSSCSDSINASGTTGVYEAVINTGTEIGWFGLEYNAQGVPDRFMIYWDDELVADSKYVGDSLTLGVPTGFSGLLGAHSGLNKFVYNGLTFPLTETGTQSFTVIQDDIADRVTEPSNGTGTIMFFKSSPTPTGVKIVSPNPLSGTAFAMKSICPVPTEELVPGEYKLVYGFLPEADKAVTTGKRTIGLWYDEAGERFYVNAFGRDTFSGDSLNPNYWNFWNGGDGVNAFDKYINDGVTWWEIDVDGTILSTGTI
jgi:hypothetical protein